MTHLLHEPVDRCCSHPSPVSRPSLQDFPGAPRVRAPGPRASEWCHCNFRNCSEDSSGDRTVMMEVRFHTGTARRLDHFSPRSAPARLPGTAAFPYPAPDKSRSRAIVPKSSGPGAVRSQLVEIPKARRRAVAGARLAHLPLEGRMSPQGKHSGASEIAQRHTDQCVDESVTPEGKVLPRSQHIPGDREGVSARMIRWPRSAEFDRTAS